MATSRTRVIAVFGLPNGKEATAGLDIQCFATATGLPANLDQSDVNAIAQAGWDGWDGTPALDDNFTTSLFLNRVESRPYTIVARTPPLYPPNERQPDVDLQPAAATGTPKPGTLVDTILPAQCAIVVSFRSTLASRHGRGRTYLPSLPESSVTDGSVLTAGQRAQLQLAYDDWVLGILNSAPVDKNFHHEVVSMITGASAEVISRLVGSRIDTQRNRLQREL